VGTGIAYQGDYLSCLLEVNPSDEKMVMQNLIADENLALAA